MNSSILIIFFCVCFSITSSKWWQKKSLQQFLITFEKCQTDDTFSKEILFWQIKSPLGQHKSNEKIHRFQSDNLKGVQHSPETKTQTQNDSNSKIYIKRKKKTLFCSEKPNRIIVVHITFDVNILRQLHHLCWALHYTMHAGTCFCMSDSAKKKMFLSLLNRFTFAHFIHKFIREKTIRKWNVDNALFFAWESLTEISRFVSHNSAFHKLYQRR